MTNPAAKSTSRTPGMDAYVARLPEGLESYPWCRLKGTVLGVMVQRTPERIIDAMPEAVRARITAQTGEHEWVPEVPTNAFIHALRDLNFSSDEAFIEWLEECSRSVLGSPFYRFIVSLASPAHLSAAGTRRWKAFREGTERVRISQHSNGSIGKVTFPPHLYDEFLAKVIMTGPRIAMEMSRAPRPTCNIVEVQPESFTTEMVYDGDLPLDAPLR